MRRSFFPAEGRFYKVNMHCHTTVSDGSLTPEEIKAAYRAAGYDAVAFTDHEVFIPHPDLTDDTFIALHGYETAIKQTPGEHTGNFQQVYHLNLLARDAGETVQPFVYPDNMTPGNCRQYLDKIRYREELCYDYSILGVNSLIERANAAGFLVTLNHPQWSMIPPERYLRLNGLHGVEVFNTGCFANGDRSGLPLGDFLRLGKYLFPVGGDDNHNRDGLAGSFGSFTMLFAREFSYAGLMEAYENGHGYASCGPEIYDIWQEDDRIGITCSPAARVTLLSEGRYTATCQGAPVTEASFPLSRAGMGDFVRLEVADREGNTAVSRGYLLSDWGL